MFGKPTFNFAIPSINHTDFEIGDCTDALSKYRILTYIYFSYYKCFETFELLAGLSKAGGGGNRSISMYHFSSGWSDSADLPSPCMRRGLSNANRHLRGS